MFYNVLLNQPKIWTHLTVNLIFALVIQWALGFNFLSCCYFSPHLSFLASDSKGRQVHPFVVHFLYIFDHICVWLSPCLLSSSPSPWLYSLSSPLPFQLLSSSFIPWFPLCLWLVHSSTFRLLLFSFLLFSSISTFWPSHPPFSLHLFLCYPAHFSPFACSLQLSLPSSLSGQEMLLSFIWICSHLKGHSEPEETWTVWSGWRWLIRPFPQWTFKWTCGK